MTYYDEDEIREARAEEAHDAFLDHAWVCLDCGEPWDPGSHRASRTDLGWVEVPECPRCGGPPEGS